MYTTAVTSAATTAVTDEREPVKLLKRIGSTTFEVTVHFSKSSTDHMADIVRRIMEREVEKSA